MKIITKDNNGITLIILIVTVVVMLILASVTTYTGLNTYETIKVKKFVVQMQLLQSKIDDLVSTMNAEELENMQLQSVTTQEQQNAINSAFSHGEITTNEISAYRVFTTDDILNILDLDSIENDVMVNFKTREVVSAKGIEYEGTTHYTQYNLPNGQTIINNGVA